MKQLIANTVIAISVLTVAPSFAGQYLPTTGIPIEDHFIVVLNDDAPSSHAREVLLQNLAGQHGAEVLRVYGAALNGGAMRMSEAKAKALAHSPFVAYVEQDSVVQLIVPAMDAQVSELSASWGEDRIDQRDLPLDKYYGYTYTGTGVKAFIIDTGIRTSHSEFGGRASIGYDSVGDGQNGNDCNGHGTHVAGTIGGDNYGVAKGVSLIAVRVLNCSGSGSISGVIAGVDYVTQNHQPDQASVANMSLGGSASTALDTAVKKSITDGVTYAVAAGNSNQDACRFSPARVSDAITIGATTKTDARASYSNYGACLDMFAPGSGITSAWIGSNTATNTISGTSMATPHAAGIAALYLESDPLAKPATVAAALKSNATSNRLASTGRKSPNLLLYSSF
ncbi:MAG: S8 family peptidase [Methylobacter sp.]